MKSFVINENDSGQRLDRFISKTCEGLPASLMYKFIRKKRIKVNGKKAEISTRLSEGDNVEMYIPDEFFEKAVTDGEYFSCPVVPDVVYEDENILLVNKAPGVLVHTGDEGDRNLTDDAERSTLIFIIRAYLVSKGEYNPKDENSFVPSLCNRIDRNTGGIVIAAKNAYTLRVLNDAIKNRQIEKYYLCAVHGMPPKNRQTLTAYMRKDYKTNMVTVYDRPLPGTKDMVTEYTLLDYEKEKDISLLEVRLHTGRTHQIRAHLAYAGLPLVGEGKYAENREDRRIGYKYQALCSYKLKFSLTDEKLSYLNDRVIKLDKKDIYFMELFK